MHPCRRQPEDLAPGQWHHPSNRKVLVRDHVLWKQRPPTRHRAEAVEFFQKLSPFVALLDLTSFKIYLCAPQRLLRPCGGLPAQKTHRRVAENAEGGAES